MLYLSLNMSLLLQVRASLQCVDDTMYDVIQAKTILPPDDQDILDVKPGVMCWTSNEGRFYKVKIVARGKCCIEWRSTNTSWHISVHQT